METVWIACSSKRICKQGCYSTLYPGRYHAIILYCNNDNLMNLFCLLGYVDIGLIPKGARDIRVLEVTETENFLAVRSEDPEKYYLNGGFIIQWSGEYKVAGTVFLYARKGDLENLTASGPTNESVWIQVQ